MEAEREGRQLMSEGLIIPRLSSAVDPSSQLLLLLALLSMKHLTEDKRVFPDPEPGPPDDFGSSFLTNLGELCRANCCFLLRVLVF